jgi:pyrroline-5-carboxylate reductase
MEGASPLLLVGAGKMGGAMLERWISAGGVNPRQITVLDPFLEAAQRSRLIDAGIDFAASATEIRDRSYATIILAVKPQAMADALCEIADLAQPETVVVSIAAGVRLRRLEAAFARSQPIVRAMPNTPAQIGLGMTVAVANDNVSPARRKTVDRLLAAVGKVAWIDDEGLIDAVTAVSGSGPAYVFLLAECLSEAARRAGLPDELADLLARETVAGAGALLANSPDTPAQLRKNVTSPAGTTAAALSVLMGDDGLEQLMVRAVDAARKRSIELG